MYICVCVPTTDADLRHEIRQRLFCRKEPLPDQSDYASVKNLRALKKDMGICQVCCKCNRSIKDVWYDEIAAIENEQAK